MLKFCFKYKITYFCAPARHQAFFFGDVAQLVEQRTENPCVGGSIPSITTQKNLPDQEVFCFDYARFNVEIPGNLLLIPRKMAFTRMLLILIQF